MTYITSVHPGLVLADELEERGIEVDELASHIAVNPRALKQVCSGKRAITADLAVRLSQALGASPAFWLNLQKNWELSQVDKSQIPRIQKLAA